MGNRYIYGPVPSRRFGLSLGVDLVPHKVCTFSCIYCQLGPTTQHTVERQDFFEPEKVIADIEEALKQGPKPDVITFAGSGEPTLYKSLDRIIDGIREITDVPVLLITNGSLLFMEDVRAAALKVDIAAPSLDASGPAPGRGSEGHVTRPQAHHGRRGRVRGDGAGRR